MPRFDPPLGPLPKKGGEESLLAAQPRLRVGLVLRFIENLPKLIWGI